VTLQPRGANVNQVILPTSSKVHRGLILSIISLIWLNDINPKSFVAQALANQKMPRITCWFAVLEALCVNLT